LHAGVVNPGGRYSINPYYLGYTILVDIEKRWEKRWDQMHAAGETALTGREKIFEVRRTEDDLSFLRNYLTPALVQRLNLFAYGSSCTHPPGKPCPQCQTVVITARERDVVVEALLAPRYNYGVPRIVIQEVVNNMLCLEHLDRATTFLDRQYANNTLMYIAEIWKHPVTLLTNDEDGRDTTLTARPNI
jgi:stage V sporulation protein R